MASALPPVRGAAFNFEISLISQADTDTFQDNPTLAAGDVKIIKDGTLDGNIDTLPTAVTSLARVLTVPLSADEMTADRVTVLFHDAAGSEWQDTVVTIYTAAQTLDATDGIADDIKATVNHVDYGNAKLTRSATPANALGIGVDGSINSVSGSIPPVTLADNVVHGGTAAQLLLKKAAIVATGNDTALSITGSGDGAGIVLAGGATGRGAEILSGLNGVNAVYISSENGHGVYIRAGRVGLNLSGNELDDGSSAVDIYNQGHTDADTIRIDNGVALGSAIQIRGYGADPVVKIHSLGTGDAIDIDGAINAENVLDEVVEGTYTLRQMMRLIGAVIAGTTSGGGTTAVSFTGLDGVTTRVTATVDANGNRTAITKTVT